MKIYTKTGDEGLTGLFGGERVSKDSARIEAYGSVDELNSFISLAVIEVKSEEVKNLLLKIQNQLFVVGSDLATPDSEKNKRYNIPRVTKQFYLDVEKEIDYFESKLEPLKNFILPSGTKGAALLHVCRAICRRVERQIVTLKSTVNIGDNILIFINRISDLFFVLARYENHFSNVSDTKWEIK
ncbi:MAG: cob(I)yrinic acid a,c-diamide adenosyltransferase [Ignavibacteriaceae bacterium]